MTTVIAPPATKKRRLLANGSIDVSQTRRISKRHGQAREQSPSPPPPYFLSAEYLASKISRNNQKEDVLYDSMGEYEAVEQVEPDDSNSNLSSTYPHTNKINITQTQTQRKTTTKTTASITTIATAGSRNEKIIISDQESDNLNGEKSQLPEIGGYDSGYDSGLISSIPSQHSDSPSHSASPLASPLLASPLALASPVNSPSPSPSPPWGRSPSPPKELEKDYTNIIKLRKRNRARRNKMSKWDQADPTAIVTMRRQQKATNFQQIKKDLNKRMTGKMPRYEEILPLVLDKDGKEIVNNDKNNEDISIYSDNSNDDLQDDDDSGDDDDKAYDPRISMKSFGRKKKKAFDFIEQGSIVKKGNQLRAKALAHDLNKLDKMDKNSKLHKINDDSVNVNEMKGINLGPNVTEDGSGLDWLVTVPLVEWWDNVLFLKDNKNKKANRKKSKMDDNNNSNDKENENENENENEKDKDDGLNLSKYESENYNYDLITDLIECPEILRASKFLKETISMPTFLTNAEKKKLKRQKKRSKQEEERDAIRLGLAEPPAPRLKVSNVMRVLGNSAIADPSAAEQRARLQQMQRKLKHDLTNAQRQLTPHQRKEKKRRKLQQLQNLNNSNSSNNSNNINGNGILNNNNSKIHVCVFRIGNYKSGRNSFKVNKTCEQFALTGCVLIANNVKLIIVEGKEKGIKFFTRLVEKRIDWTLGIQNDVDDSGNSGSNVKRSNNSTSKPMKNGKFDNSNGGGDNNSNDLAFCEKIWNGVICKRNFQTFITKFVLSDREAKDFLKLRRCHQYWVLAESMPIPN